MARNQENTDFVCAKCGMQVYALTNGSYRNHCPFCLYSLHVDNHPGDRANPCCGLMRPVGLTYKTKKGWQIIHSCNRCNHRAVNKIAVDTVQPDCYQKLAECNFH